MLVIRREQLDVFEEAARAHFVRRAVEHLQRTLPAHCASMTPGALRASARHAVTRARSYGITAEVDVLTYLNVMYMLGFEFDTDPRFSWASEWLREPEVQGHAKVRLVFERARRELFP
ncbi:MAG: hypothetical protein ABSE49_03660 [Polyangiaceae bacterium]